MVRWRLNISDVQMQRRDRSILIISSKPFDFLEDETKMLNLKTTEILKILLGLEHIILYSQHFHNFYTSNWFQCYQWVGGYFCGFSFVIFRSRIQWTGLDWTKSECDRLRQFRAIKIGELNSAVGGKNYIFSIFSDIDGFVWKFINVITSLGFRISWIAVSTNHRWSCSSIGINIRFFFVARQFSHNNRHWNHVRLHGNRTM